MITLALINRNAHDAIYIIQLKRRVWTVTVPVTRRKKRLNEYRHAICKTTHLNASDIRFVSNHKIGNHWVQFWRLK